MQGLRSMMANGLSLMGQFPTKGCRAVKPSQSSTGRSDRTDECVYHGQKNEVETEVGCVAALHEVGVGFPGSEQVASELG